MKLLSAVVIAAQADVYMHMPRGSNNRLNEERKDRANGNRLFDSQNNNNGGYNVADKGSLAAVNITGQHQEMYFQSGQVGKSYLNLEWFDQHGCGKRDPTDVNAIDCHIILQYKCQAANQGGRMRNGFSTETPQFTKLDRNQQETSVSETLARKEEDLAVNDEQGEERGEHEAWENHDACTTRERNHGLFLADQRLHGSSSIHTRQNPGGHRRGYECPEERDYFPYWHPTEWTDVAVLTSNTDSCDYYKKESSNSAPKGECVELLTDKNTQEKTRLKHASEANNPADCGKLEGGVWMEFYDYKSVIDSSVNGTVIDSKDLCQAAASEFSLDQESLVKWGYPRQIGEERFLVPEEKCLLLHPEVDCKEAPWSRANHLGNSDNGDFATYRWELPQLEGEQECVLRMRYNISSDDYPEQLDSTSIETYFSGQVFDEDPKIITRQGIKLQLALDSAQVARTFQDRSHTFRLVPREDFGIGDEETIENLQVRGKRGNIVQTFPAVEYDFSPQRMTMNSSSLLHIQWAGSNSNPRGNDGEGERGTDRSNMVTVKNPNWNIPVNELEYEYLTSERKEAKWWAVLRTDMMPFEQAFEYCRENNMQLPVPTNEDENEAFGRIPGGNFFLGISDHKEEGTFINVYTNETVTYTKWAHNEPNNFTRHWGLFKNGEDFVVMRKSSHNEWNDAPANYRDRGYGSVQTVCVREVASVPDNYTATEDQGDAPYHSYTGWPTEESVSWRVHRSQYRSFHDAHKFCSNFGMELPVPENDSQNKALATLEGGNFYLGLTDETEEGTFKSLYSGQVADFEAFDRHQPNNHIRENSIFENGEDFVVLKTESGKWNDVPPNFNNRWEGSAQTVCVAPADSQIPTQEGLFDHVQEWVWSAGVTSSNIKDDLSVQMASSGYYDCVSGCDKSTDNSDLEELSPVLNNAPASFHGNLVRFDKPGQHYYLSTRNNNFSNRAQKGDLLLV